MLTAVVTRCAIWVARGPSSMLKKTCSHAPRLTSINPASSRKERLNNPRRNRDWLLLRCFGEGGMATRRNYAGESLMTAVRYEDIAQAPDSLDEHRFGGVGFHQLAQT